MGLPVVASAVGWLPELIVDGQTGWLVPLGDPGALAQQWRALLHASGCLLAGLGPRLEEARRCVILPGNDSKPVYPEHKGQRHEKAPPDGS
jgi:glycosyltransferase involved in cell wall biosynthesis